MKPTLRTVLLLAVIIGGTSCASHPPQKPSHKKLKLETIDHGPHRPKTYLYREVDDR